MHRTPIIRPALPSETEALVQLGRATGIFSDGEAEELLGQTLDSLHAGKLPSNHQAHVVIMEGSSDPMGWCYFGPEEDKSRSYNLWWIGISPASQGQGLGRQLLKFVEASVQLEENNASQLVIETSSVDKLARTREFYARQGYNTLRIEKDGYGPGEHKVVFVKVF